MGVQYWLAALVEGRITPEEFLNLNATVGSWKAQSAMRGERYWKLPGARSSLKDASLWSHHNMQLSPDEGRTPAPRHEGSLEAIEAAYRSGHVFMGQIAIPIIDVRHYMEPELSMHHSVASFQARMRMSRGQGHADNQLIWMTRKPHEPLDECFRLIDRWMMRILADPHRRVVENKPADAVDRCYDEEGRLIAEGSDVWDGDWNDKPPGKCMETYPIFSNSRVVAGADLAGSTIKCQLQSVELAMERGVYGDVDMRPHLERLKVIFPRGVCDYSLPGAGRPLDLL